MRFKYLSLFFASIGPKQAFLILCAGLSTIFFGRLIRRNLETMVKSEYGGHQVLAYSSARGSLAAFLRAAGIGPEDSVLLSCFTCLAVPTAVIACGARPIYADINVGTLNVNLKSIKELVEEDTRAIVVQHTLGHPVDEITEICRFAKDNGLLVIEDCALSLGSKCNGVSIGFHGDAAIFSLELSKTLSCGWGGLLINNNLRLQHALVEEYKNIPEESKRTQFRKVLQIGITGIFYSKYIYSLGKYIVAVCFKINFFKGSTPTGEYKGEISSRFISRLGAPQARLAIHQFKRLNAISAVNNHNFLFIHQSLKSSGLCVLGVVSEHHFLVSPRVAFLVNDPKAASDWFYKNGIELGGWFNSELSTLPVFNFDVEKFPNLKTISKHIVNLPCHNRITESDLIWLDSVIASFAKENPSQCNCNFF